MTNDTVTAPFPRPSKYQKWWADNWKKKPSPRIYRQALTHLEGTPLAVLDPDELVGEAHLLGELLQQVDAEAAAALVRAAVALARLEVRPVSSREYEDQPRFRRNADDIYICIIRPGWEGTRRGAELSARVMRLIEITRGGICLRICYCNFIEINAAMKSYYNGMVERMVFDSGISWLFFYVKCKICAEA